MVGRVLLSPSSIRVSRPGVEVTTASYRDLLLDIGMRQGQIVGHGSILLTPGSGGGNYGPWSGGADIGPFSSVPDVILSFIFEGGRQTYPAMQRVTGGRGFRGWQFSNVNLTTNRLDVSVAAQPVAVDGITPQALVGIGFLVFRRPII